MYHLNYYDCQGAGALAILVMAFTAGVGWRRQGWDDDNPVADSLAKMWIVFQPLLFSLIGAEIQVTSNTIKRILKPCVFCTGAGHVPVHSGLGLPGAGGRTLHPAAGSILSSLWGKVRTKEFQNF